MYTFLVVLILIVSVLLAAVVLVQNSKGGGLAANFSAPNQIMGVRKTADFLEKATWTLAVALMVLSLMATITIRSGNSSATPQSVLTTQNEPVTTAGSLGTQAPASTATATPAGEADNQ